MPMAIHDDETDIVKITPPGSAHDLKLDTTHYEHQPLHVKEEKPSIEEEVQRKMDETVRRVREQSDRLQAAATPYAQKTRDFAEHRPVLFVSRDGAVKR